MTDYDILSSPNVFIGDPETLNHGFPIKIFGNDKLKLKPFLEDYAAARTALRKVSDFTSATNKEESFLFC